MLRGAVLAALLALSGAAPSPWEGWDEIAWNLPRDAWPAGRAYRCRGCDAVVYVRPKIGFCNCTTGVTEDSEVDAVSDMDAIAADFSGVAEGEKVVAAGLRGRERVYALHGRGGDRVASGFALSSKCDLLVAAAVGRDAGDRARVTGLLDSAEVRGWIAQSLGLASGS